MARSPRVPAIVLLLAIVVAAAVLLAADRREPVTVVVAVPARAGAVDDKTYNSDEFIWRAFCQFAAPAVKGQASPVVFETWASDADTFTTNPQWPDVDAPKKFQTSVLGMMSTPNNPIDVPCVTFAKGIGGAAVGGFPTTGTPTPCIAEEVKRNRPQFDYIVDNKLNTKAGLAAAYANDFKVAMPTESISVKADWIPVQTLLQWIPELGSLDNIRKLYYIAQSGGVEYGLVALHVSSRQNPNWVWGTFEHRYNPGRCDSIGCFDTYGAKKAAVLPNKKTVNTQYGPCEKTDRVKALMRQGGLSPVWENYCLKSTQVDYAAADGTPYVLGSSVIERITGNGTVAASSCIACHVYASYGADGAPTAMATNILPFNPTGPPIQNVLSGSQQFDFMWGVLLAP